MSASIRGYLAAAILLLVPAAAQAADTAWRIEDKTDAVTDQRSFSAILSGDGGELQIGCSNAAAGKLSVYLLAPRGVFFGSGLRNMIYRVDSATAQTEQWYYSDDIATAAPYSDPAARIKTMVEAVEAGSKLVLRSQDYRGNLRDAVFALPADHSAVERARAVCGGVASK